jgi:hypothetical protein
MRNVTWKNAAPGTSQLLNPRTAWPSGGVGQKTMSNTLVVHPNGNHRCTGQRFTARVKHAIEIEQGRLIEVPLCY